MAINLQQKKDVVAMLEAEFLASTSVLTAQYTGLSVADLTKLREQARTRNVAVKVAKNTLVRRAVQNTSFKPLDEHLQGQLLVAFAKDGPGDAAKVFHDFGKDNPTLEVRNISLGGDVLDGSQLQAVSKLPSREEALASLLGLMQAPITKFAQTLNEVPSKLVRTLSAVKDAKSA